MPATNSPRSLDEIARLGEKVFDQQLKPTFRPQDDGKFVAIDVDAGDFEIDEDDYTAVMRLRSRKPDAEVWLSRVGYPTTCRVGRLR